jgi:pyruvate dehydrogenase E2 component (dihydrolipoamide acetyltransferase)
MAIEILMPALSPTMEEGTLAKWLVKEGDVVKSGDLLAEIETDKATMEFEAVDEGVISKILVVDGTEGVLVNTPICILLEGGEDVSSTVKLPVPKIQEADVIPKSEPSMSSSRTATKKDGNRLFSSPLARRIAEKRGLDLTSLEGSGPRGRIVKADVENVSPLATKRNSTLERELTTPRLATSVNNENVKKMYAEREYEEISLDGMRKTVAARLTEAKQTIPHFYLRQSIGLDALLKTRNEINSGIADNGLKISINDFIIKASAKALQDVPGCNTIWAGDRLLQMKASDVAVAVAIDNGLFTPVIQDAELKTLSVISNEMKDLATRAKERKLVPKEYQGGSFAISNLGMFGIENFDAIINPPHGSILAVGAGQKQPIVKADGALASATKMSVTLSVDHRVIDGALGARFLSAIAGYIEKPLSMLV